MTTAAGRKAQPSFEFPRQHLPASVRFVGTPPIVANQAPLPPWAHDLDGSRKVVLVTQGTLSNHDFSELLVPALGALAEEPDARLADYLPVEWLFPRVDALVTNGGYGTVNQALSYVNARVAWSGAGIDLQTTMPAPEALRAAVRHVLDEPQYRMRAKVLAAEFATLDTTSEILAVLTELAGAAPLPD
jgi:UDP:flavonoid glycosyltransferase YjiC (YdhE family)